MGGNFTIGLLEIFAYLIPGGIALAALLYRYFPFLAERVSQGFWFQVFFLTCSYILGHLLTMISVAFPKLRGSIKKALGTKQREERLSFYPELRDELHKLFGSQITRGDEYLMALRLVAENQPKSIQEIDRLYALTLFSRNTVVSFILMASAFLTTNRAICIISVILSLSFFVRYIQLEAATANTVFRSAYVYLWTKERFETNNGQNGPDHQPDRQHTS